jgi:hypothetical protein
VLHLAALGGFFLFDGGAVECSSEHYMNRQLFDLLRRIEEGSRRLASTITHNDDKPVRDIPLADVEIK